MVTQLEVPPFFEGKLGVPALFGPPPRSDSIWQKQTDFFHPTAMIFVCFVDKKTPQHFDFDANEYALHLPSEDKTITFQAKK